MHPPLYNKDNLFLSLRFCNVRILKAVVRRLSVKKVAWHRCFSVSFAKFLRKSFPQNPSSGCFWHLHQSSVLILILYVINWELRREYFSFFLWSIMEDYIFTSVLLRIITFFIIMKMWHCIFSNPFTISKFQGVMYKGK